MITLTVALSITILLPWVTFAYTCLLLWATDSLKNGVLSALSFGNLESVLTFFFLVDGVDRLVLFGYVVYTIFLLILGCVPILVKGFVDRKFGRSYVFFISGLAAVSAWFTVEILNYSDFYLLLLGMALLSLVAGMRRGMDIVRYARALRQQIRRLQGQP